MRGTEKHGAPRTGDMILHSPSARLRVAIPHDKCRNVPLANARTVALCAASRWARIAGRRLPYWLNEPRRDFGGMVTQEIEL